MQKFAKLFVVLFWGCLGTAYAEKHIAYEPAVVTLSGKISRAKFQHPNGQWVPFLFVKLDQSVGINGEDDFNVEEHGVKEVQIYSASSSTRKKLSSLVGKHATLSGTVFHEHTAWHVRKLVMSVSEVKRDAPSSARPDPQKVR